MNASVDRSVLLRVLLFCSGVIEKRVTMPVLQNVLLSADESFGLIHAFATDTEISTSIHCEATVNEAGTFLIGLETFIEILRNLPDETVLIKTADAKVTIESGTARFALPIPNGADFPGMPETEGPVRLVTDASILVEGIRTVSYAIGLPDPNMLMTVLSVTSANGSLEFAATDAKRLAVTSCEWTSEKEALHFTVPPKAARAISKIDPRGDVRIKTDDFRTEVAFENGVLIYRKVDGNFPNYTAIIPNAYGAQVTTDRKRLIDALRRIQLMTPNDRGVSLTIASGRLTVAPLRDECGQGRDYLPVEGDAAFTTLLSGQYATQALEAIGTERVLLGVSDRLVGFEPVDPDGPMRSKHLIVPRVPVDIA